METSDIALLGMRIILGIVFFVHGSQKMFGWFEGPSLSGTTQMMSSLGMRSPGMMAKIAALSEFVGGTFILLGLFTHFAAAFIISTMLVAIATVHFKNGFLNTKHGYEFNLSLIGLAFGLMMMGAGAVSVDRLLGMDVAIDALPALAIPILLAICVGGLISVQILRHNPQGTTIAGQHR
jgi:putative oxidoreductase